MESEHRNQGQYAADERIAVDDAGQSASECDIDEPVEDGDGCDGAVAAQTEVREEGYDGDGSNDQGVQDAGFDVEVGDLYHVGASDDCCAIDIAGR